MASAERALEVSKDTPEPSRSAAIYAIQAMARHQLGQIADARKSLADAMKLFDENWPLMNQGKLGASWHNVLIAHLLTREAVALMDGHP